MAAPSVADPQALGLTAAASMDEDEETGRVCYPVWQFRCLVREATMGQHVLGKGLLVVDEAGHG